MATKFIVSSETISDNYGEQQQYYSTITEIPGISGISKNLYIDLFL